MTNNKKPARFPGPGVDFAPAEQFFRQEVQLALRNKGMPLEGMRYDITPTGMHYLLVHFDIPEVPAKSWKLKVEGLVRTSLSLSLEELQRRPKQTLAVTMECAGNGRALMDPRPVSQPWHVEAIGTAEWAGTPLRPILEEAGVQDAAVELVFTGLDKGVQGDEVQLYQRSLTIEEAMRDEVLLAYEMNGRPLEPQHGYPLRLLVPGWYGMTSVKWLAAIEAVAQPFTGYQQFGSYRYTQRLDDVGDPVSLINVRALMIPPGIPDFATRGRLLDPGPVTLTGRAWAGRNEVTRVEVSTDGGEKWDEATLDPAIGPYAWRGWRYDWMAEPGRHTLLVRATDSEGNTQPLEQPWNAHGMGNNLAQRVTVLVE
jgi:DMSO/TMAO reductase YedYZ molybdopterin-dependent catalytic subunit